MHIEFQNSKSEALFGLKNGAQIDDSCISTPGLMCSQFVAIDGVTGAQIFEPDSDALSWRLNALRAFIDEQQSNNLSERESLRSQQASEIFSLREIFTKDEKDNENVS